MHSLHSSSIINRPNCGGCKKTGLAPRIGVYISSNVALIRAANTQWINGKKPVCPANIRNNPTQQIGYKATLVMM